MRARSAGRSLGAGGRRMADAVLFEFLHTEMVAELWAHDPDPGPGGQNMSLSVLEGMGFRVGQALGERLSRETLAYREELDILKFLCKDLWMAVFQKQMDSLRTNHQGTYVLQDNSFPLLIRMASGLQYLEEAPKVTPLPGLQRDRTLQSGGRRPALTSARRSAGSPLHTLSWQWAEHHHSLFQSPTLPPRDLVRRTTPFRASVSHLQSGHHPWHGGRARKDGATAGKAWPLCVTPGKRSLCVSSS
uniref:Trafficking protein particle complex subunit 6A n=1 Tax=Equus asinus TaxID=9793 RepID=A0A9L0JMU8_EQUAS